LPALLTLKSPTPMLLYVNPFARLSWSFPPFRKIPFFPYFLFTPRSSFLLVTSFVPQRLDRLLFPSGDQSHQRFGGRQALCLFFCCQASVLFKNCNFYDSHSFLAAVFPVLPFPPARRAVSTVPSKGSFPVPVNFFSLFVVLAFSHPFLYRCAVSPFFSSLGPIFPRPGCGIVGDLNPSGRALRSSPLGRPWSKGEQITTPDSKSES